MTDEFEVVDAVPRRGGGRWANVIAFALTLPPGKAVVVPLGRRPARSVGNELGVYIKAHSLPLRVAVRGDKCYLERTPDAETIKEGK